MTQPNRLEDALAVYLRHQQLGSDWQEVLTAHPDLADLLAAFHDEHEHGEAPEQVGDYRIERELGRGGNGIVYAASDRRLGRRAAVKLLHGDIAGRPATVARFLREAQLLARLDHRGIVKVLDVGSHAGRPWLAMELLDGPSLAQRIDTLRATGGHAGDSLRELVAAVAQVAEALGHAHQAGVVHRDVKPSNVLLRSDGSAVLTDFGIARDADDPSLTNTGVVVGSPHYMAPEQALGRAAEQGPGSDVFALGATLYECLTLARAFPGDSPQQVIQAILYRDPIDPRRVLPGLPRDLVAIAGKALEKNPAHRYPSAAAFAADLRAFLELREVSARTTTRVTRWLRRARREPAFGVSLGIAVLLLAVLVWLGLQWPHVAAARAAERDRAYDAATAAGFAGQEGQRAWFEQAIELDPTRPEALFGLALVVNDREGPAAALAELERRGGAADDVALVRCRAWLLRAAGRIDEATALEAGLPPPRSSIDLWLRALFLMATPPTPDAARIEALTTMSLAVRTSPRPHLSLQVYWTELANLGGGKEQRVEAAESLLRQWPDSPVALQVAGEALMQYDPKRAIGILQRALDGGVTDPRCEVSLGFAYAMARETPACIAQLEKACRREDLAAAPRGSVMLMLEQLQAFELADRLAAAWVQSAPDVPEARRAAGRAARRRGAYDEALVHLDRAVELRPDDLALRLDRVVMQSALGAQQWLRDELQQLVAAHPTHAGPHGYLVQVLSDDGDRDALLVELRRWTQSTPDDADNWRTLARTLLEHEAPDVLAEALAAAERADYLAKGADRAALELRATAIERLGDAAEAARLRRRAEALPAAR